MQLYHHCVLYIFLISTSRHDGGYKKLRDSLYLKAFPEFLEKSGEQNCTDIVTILYANRTAFLGFLAVLSPVLCGLLLLYGLIPEALVFPFQLTKDSTKQAYKKRVFRGLS